MNRRLPISDRVSLIVVASACSFHLVMGTVLAYTRLPICDEGFYGVPAHVLSVTGELRNPVLESAGIGYLRGIDLHFHWMAPLGMVLQAGVFKAFGFGLVVQREFSVVCGSGAILLWYLALRRLIAERTASLAAVLLSVDYVLLTLSSRGRSDVMSLFFAMAAVAGYMHWRERCLPLALVAANAACALSGMIHPNGGIASVVSLAVLVFCLDRPRLRWRHLGVAAGAYGLLGAGWGLYISRSPDLFVTQFLGNVGNRFAGPMTPTRLIMGEASRYLSAFGLLDARGAKLARYLLPLLFLAAIGYCVRFREARRSGRVLLLILAGVSLSLVFLEGSKQGWYTVHQSPALAAILALAATRWWQGGALRGRIATAAAGFVVSLGVASLAHSAGNLHLQRLYQPAVAFLNGRVGPRDLVFARSEFYFGLKCRTCLRDDEHLGAISGRRADFIVMDSEYEGRREALRRSNPAVSRDIERRLSSDYREEFRNQAYRILRRATAESRLGAENN